MTLTELRSAAEAIARSAISAVEPEALVHNSVRLEGDCLQIPNESINLSDFKRIIIIGAGKACAAMEKALENILGDRISDGLIVVKEGYAKPLERVSIREAGHPVPDVRGMEAAQEILSLVSKSARPDTLIIFLISGGGSALLPLPYDGISLEAKRETTESLLLCGASIDEINSVRKHISKIKGGRLAIEAAPARLLCLILSDVIGDPLDVIASGPTVGDPSTYSGAMSILQKYKIWNNVPESVRQAIERGVGRHIEETPFPGDDIFRNVSTMVIGNNRTAVEAASRKAASLGFDPLMLTTSISGEAREVGTVFASIAREVESSGNPVKSPACILAGGETTVTVRGDGKGGRNQEFALAAALSLQSAQKIVIAGIGTDGNDGPTDAAGGIVDMTTIERASARGLDASDYLERNDSYRLLEAIGDLLVTGPTGTNVMDLLIGIIG